VSRVAPVTAHGAVVAAIKERRGGHLTPLDEVLLHSEPLAAGWNTLLGAVRSQLEVPGLLQELAICRIAALNGADYEWRAHAPLALAHGLSDTELCALREGADPAPLKPLHRQTRDYTDSMTLAVTVPDDLSDRLRIALGDKQFVELTGTIAVYNMVSRFLVALHIGTDR
jgi:4-carboxymuconolactone decarboxylase